MSSKKLSLAVVVGATLALGACSWHEVRTETVSKHTETIPAGSVASASDLMSNTGASSGAAGAGAVGVTRSRTMERDAFGQWHEVR